jgi:hypothetical protein
MHWFGINWLDVILNTAALSIVPGLTALGGGHLAAEAVSESRKKIAWRVTFFILFVFSVALTGWQQVRAATSEFERNTADEWLRTLLVRTLFRPVLPPNFAYLKTPKPTISPAQRPTPETISAPNGIAIGGNARVDHPTVNNNYGEMRVSRVMTDAQLSRMVELARTTPTHAMVSCLSGDVEAYDLAKQIQGALTSAGWDVEPVIRSFISGGAPEPGIKVAYKGPTATGPTVNVSRPSPEYGLAVSFANANLVYYLNPSPDGKENNVMILVDAAPRGK